MQQLKDMLTQQKAQIEKDLEQVGHNMYTLKIQEVRLKKMLKNVDAQIKLTEDEVK